MGDGVDFSWNAEQEELFRTARRLAGEKLSSHGRPTAGGEAFDADAWRACAEFGLPGLCVPTQYGGLGLDLLTSARVIEGFGEGTDNLGVVFAACAHLFACCVPISRGGTDALKERILPKLASGEIVGANAITESEAGSDVHAMKARAERTSDGYRISGSKIFVTNGPVADVIVVYATLDPGLGFLGINAFVVERDTPGLEIGPPMEKVGLHGSLIGSLYLDDCVVPEENRIAGDGQGASVFRSSMLAERSCLFAVYLGAMQRQLEQAIEFASARVQFGRSIAKNQAVSHRIVDMKLRLESARALVYRACWLADRGDESALAVSLAKLAVSECAVASSLDLIQLHGALGLMEESGVSRGLLDALPSTIYSGTSEMQREIIAAELGL